MTPEPRPPIELRSVALSAVSDPRDEKSERIIELIAVPYDRWAVVEADGRIIEESFAPGAFTGVQNRAGHSRFQVNIDHDPAQWIGRVLALHPDDPVGLRAELKIRQTPEGNQVLIDAFDGMYGASIGFGVKPTDQVWETKDRRRITKAYLDHIALTPTPAYATAGRISVRTARSQTPNLDRILASRAART